MPEPTTTASAAGLAAALAAIEATTGLQVPLVMWAALGGYWAFRWLDPMPLMQRCGALAISALIGAVGLTEQDIDALFITAAGIKA